MIGRSTKHIIEFVLLAALGAAILGGLAAWRLSQGPVNLGFLNGHVESGLNDLGIPLEIKIGGTQLAWAGWDRALDIRIADVRILDNENQLVANIADTSVRFSIRGLLRGVMAPRTIDIHEPALQIRRDEDGQVAFALGAGGDTSTAANMAVLDKIIQALRDEDDPGRPITYLRRLSILGATLSLNDLKTGALWNARAADFILLAESRGVQATFSAESEIEGHAMHVDGTASLPTGGDQVVVAAHVENIRPNALASRIGVLAPLRGVDLVLNGAVTMTLSETGQPEKAGFHLTSGKGRIVAGDLWPKGLDLASGLFRGTVDLQNRQLDVQSLRLDLAGPVVDAAITGSMNAGIAGVQMNARIENIRSADFERLWPQNAATGGRRWVLANVAAGNISGGRISSEMEFDTGTQSLELKTLKGAARIDGVEITYMDGMPGVKNARGTAELSPDAVIFRIEEALSEGVKVEKGTVALTGFSTSKEIATIDVTLLGPLQNKIGIIDAPRLGYAKRFGIDPRELAGQARTRLRVEVPLIAAISLDGVRLNAASSITGAGIPRIAAGKDITDGTFTLKLDLAGLEMNGDARIAGAPAKLRWIERFGENERYVRRLEAKSVLAQPHWEAFGFSNFSPWLSGALGIDLAFLQPAAGKPAEIVAKLQLQDTQIQVEEFGWKKPAGRVALAWVNALSHQDGRVDVKNFNMATDGLKLSGSVSLDKDGKLIGLGLSRFILGKTNLTLAAAPDVETGGFAVTVKGASVDATRLFEPDDGQPKKNSAPPIALTVDIDRLHIGDETTLNGVKGTITRDSESVRSARLTSVLNKNKVMRIAFDLSGRDQIVSINADDAGGVVQSFGISEAMKGGTLKIVARKKGAAPADGWSGVAEINGFTLVDAPVLGRMLTLASLSGILNTLSGKGIAFARFQAPFRWQNDVLKFANARAVGSELGITGDGSYDLNRDLLDIKGTIVPAYTLNSVLGNIPVLGTILTGKKGSGVFAVTYRVVGKGNDPGVKVNPLSALAPGFLRNFIDIFNTNGKSDLGVADPDRGQPP